MLQTTPDFDALHALPYKTPFWLVAFEGEVTSYSNWKGYGGLALLQEDVFYLLQENSFLLNQDQSETKAYLKSISSLSRTINPEEGKASVSGMTVSILDVDDEITALLSTDAYYFHRKKVTIQVGYKGLDGTDLITITTGWVTDVKLSGDGLAWDFSITDPIKWMQRKIFRGSEDSTVTLAGNPLNILLACLTSTGAGTNGAYDYLPEVDALGIDEDYIDVSSIEAIRDDWYPGSSNYMRFTITKREKAKDFFEREIFKVLNLYPIIDGEGRFLLKRFSPPLITGTAVQSYTEDNVIGLPGYNMNLGALVNEVEFFYNHDGDDFLNEVYYIESDSLNNRGPGKKPVTIKSKGLHTSLSPSSITTDVENIIIRRKNAIFNRFATPPIRLSIDAWFSQWLSEAGDIVPVTHSKLPNIEQGVRGLDEARMEIVKKSVDFKTGKVKVDVVDTGFDKDLYCVISPTMTVVTGTSATAFTVSLADAIKFADFTLPEMRVSDQGMRSQAHPITILTVDTATGEITCDSIGATPAAGWIISFAEYDDLTDEQKLYWALSDGSDELGSAPDPAQLIVP